MFWNTTIHNKINTTLYHVSKLEDFQSKIPPPFTYVAAYAIKANSKCFIVYVASISPNQHVCINRKMQCPAKHFVNANCTMQYNHFTTNGFHVTTEQDGRPKNLILDTNSFVVVLPEDKLPVEFSLGADMAALSTDNSARLVEGTFSVVNPMLTPLKQVCSVCLSWDIELVGAGLIDCKRCKGEKPMGTVPYVVGDLEVQSATVGQIISHKGLVVKGDVVATLFGDDFATLSSPALRRRLREQITGTFKLLHSREVVEFTS